MVHPAVFIVLGILIIGGTFGGIYAVDTTGPTYLVNAGVELCDSTDDNLVGVPIGGARITFTEKSGFILFPYSAEATSQTSTGLLVVQLQPGTYTVHGDFPSDPTKYNTFDGTLSVDGPGVVYNKVCLANMGGSQNQ